MRPEGKVLPNRYKTLPPSIILFDPLCCLPSGLPRPFSAFELSGRKDMASAWEGCRSDRVSKPFHYENSLLPPDFSQDPNRVPTRFSRRRCPPRCKPNQTYIDRFHFGRRRILDAIHPSRSIPRPRQGALGIYNFPLPRF